MTSKTAIVNVALTRIGVTTQIGNVETERSRQAITARQIYDDDVDYVLRDFPWPFATAYATLALVEGTVSVPVNRDWQYSYRFPSDCLYARRLVVESLGRNNPNPPPFRLGKDSSGRLIFTREADAELEYTMRVTDSAEFDPMFVSMLEWKIGAGLAPGLSRIKGMAQSCMEMYEIERTKAQSRALNEGQQETPLESEFITSRD